MNVDRDKLIALVRKETGIKLEADDPVLAVAVLHEKVLEPALERVEAAAQAAAGRMGHATDRAVEAARSEAGRVVTEAAEWVAERLREAAAEVSATLVQETQAEVAKAEAARRAAVRAAWIAGCTSAGGVVAVVAVAAAVFWH